MNLTKLLFEKINNNIKTKTPDFEKWCIHIDLLIRKDKRDIKEIEKVIEFSQTNDFWKSNIRSTKKLREKYETLFLQMQEKQNKKNNEKQFSGERDNDHYKEIFKMDFSQVDEDFDEEEYKKSDHYKNIMEGNK